MASRDESLDEVEQSMLLTIAEASRLLRIGRSLAYEMAREYLASGGTTGLPVIRLSRGSLRVPRWALLELIATGRLVRLCDAETNPVGAAGVR